MFRRNNIKFVVAVVALLVIGASAPAVGHGDRHARFAHNAGKVDRKSAVPANASINRRKGKLVATRHGDGRLPNNIIRKAPDANRVDGINSPQLQFPSRVPVGRTVVGSWGFDYDTDGSGDWATRISYPAPMPATLEFHFIPQGDPNPAPQVCPGSIADPKAAMGHVCLYGVIAGASNNAGPYAFANHEFGFNLLVSDDGNAGDMYGYGTWAATSVSPANALVTTQQTTKP